MVRTCKWTVQRDCSFQLPWNPLSYSLELQVLSNTRQILKCIPHLCQKRQYSSFHWNIKGVFLFQGREYYFQILSRLWGTFQIQKVLQSMTVINAWQWELTVYFKHRINTGQKTKKKKKKGVLPLRCLFKHGDDDDLSYIQVSIEQKRKICIPIFLLLFNLFCYLGLNLNL